MEEERENSGDFSGKINKVRKIHELLQEKIPQLKKKLFWDKNKGFFQGLFVSFVLHIECLKGAYIKACIDHTCFNGIISTGEKTRV